MPTDLAFSKASPAERGAWGWLLNFWRPVLLVLLCLDIPIVALGRLYLPGDLSFGFVSFTRNIAILLVLGVWLGAPGLPRPHSRLTLPFLLFFLCAWVSVALGGGAWGEVRWLGFALAFFYGVRSIAASASGRQFLFHWLGALAVASVLAEIWLHPEVLHFDQMRRNEMATGHPNIIAGFFAILAPVFLGSREKEPWQRGLSLLYFGFAVFGVLMTFSRLSFAGLGLGIVAVALARWSRRFPARAWLLSGAGVVLAGSFVLYLSDGRLEADENRLRIMQTSWSVFTEHWFWGVGWGSNNLKPFFVERYDSIFGTALWFYHSHNMYLEILVATGVVGAAAAVLVFVRLGDLARRAWRLLDVEESHAGSAVGLIASLLVFLWLGLGEVPIYYARTLFPLVVVWSLLEGWVEARGGKGA